MAEVVGLDVGGVLLGHAADALLGHPVVLDELGLARRVDPLVGVDAEALLVAVVRRDAARAEQVDQHVHALGRLRHEVEDAPGLLLEGDRVRLERVDDVGELDRVADEEDGEVVADEVPVAVLGVELHREAARVAGGLGGVPPADDGGEADGEVGALAPLLEQLGPGVAVDGFVAPGAVRLEIAVRRDPAGVHHTLGDALAVEVADLLQELVVLQRGGAAGADRALVLVVVDGVPLAVGEHLAVVARGGPLARYVRHVRGLLRLVAAVGRGPERRGGRRPRTWVVRVPRDEVPVTYRCAHIRGISHQGPGHPAQWASGPVTGGA